MKTVSFLTTLVLGLLLSFCIAGASDFENADGMYLKRYIVNFKTDKSVSLERKQNEVLRFLNPNKSSIPHMKFKYVNGMVVELDEFDKQRLETHPYVESVREELVMYPSLSKSTEQIGATTAWSSGYTGEGQVIAILDSGVDSSHEMFRGKIVSEACYVYNNSCPNGKNIDISVGSARPTYLTEKWEHGNHVAGIAAGSSRYLSGVARGAKIIAINVFYGDETGMISGEGLLILALERVYELRNTYRIAAVNMSLAGNVYTDYCDQSPVKQMIDRLRSVGIATIIASGNNKSSNGVSHPACISTAISVGAVDSRDNITYFSNSFRHLKLLAPSIVESAVFDNKYGFKGGTSMSAPHVAGAWALMKQRNPNATVDDILNAFVTTGTPIYDSRNGVVTPRIDVGKALNALIACTFSVDKNQININSDSQSVKIRVNSNCSWTVINNANWITISSSTGSGNAEITLTIQANVETFSRNASIKIGSAIVNINQSGIRLFTVTITKSGSSANISNVTSSAGTINWSGNVGKLTVPENTIVTLTVNNPANVLFAGWAGDCSGSGECVLQMNDNKNAVATFNQIQPCVYYPTIRSATYNKEATPVMSFTVYTHLYCSYKAYTDVSWIRLRDSNVTVTGPYTFNYSLDANRSGQVRTGRIFVADKIITIYQRN